MNCRLEIHHLYHVLRGSSKCSSLCSATEGKKKDSLHFFSLMYVYIALFDHWKTKGFLILQIAMMLDAQDVSKVTHTGQFTAWATMFTFGLNASSRQKRYLHRSHVSDNRGSCVRNSINWKFRVNFFTQRLKK